MALLLAVANFKNFTPSNDPYNERDFGAVEIDGERYFWKIYYYDLDLLYHSPDPAVPEVTQRITVVMRADEY